MASSESLRNNQGYLEETIGRTVRLMKSMPEGERRDQPLYEIGKLDVNANGIKEALYVMEEHD